MTQLHYITLRDPSNPARPRHLGYYQWDDAGNTNVLVCVHGLSRNARDFDVLAAKLSSQYRILCIDIAGRGNSDWLNNKSDYNYFTYVADVIALMQALNLSKVSFLGTSMGGIIGMMIAANRPQLIGKLILNDIGKIVSGQGLTRIMSYVGSSLSHFESKTEAMAYLQSIAAPFGIESEAQWEQMFSATFITLPDGKFALAYDPDITLPLKEAAAKAETIVDIDLSAVWAGISCPLLILRGKDSDILTAATAQAMCERQVSTQLVEFDHTGHAPALLSDHQISIVADWLKKS